MEFGEGVKFATDETEAGVKLVAYEGHSAILIVFCKNTERISTYRLEFPKPIRSLGLKSDIVVAS